jgi:hypothetical protein
MKPGDRRKAYGEARASVVESLLQTLYPGAQVLSEPFLALQIPGEQPRFVEVPVYVRGSPTTGGLEGVASVEFEQLKEKFIFQASGFQTSDAPNFSTQLIVFRADVSGHIQKYKTFLLDPDESLTEMKNMSIKNWSQAEWPTLEILYDTHRSSPSSFTTIEWRGEFDADGGRFISRLPGGISRKRKGGAEQQFWLRLGRSSPTTVLMAEQFTGQTRQYECSDPCVMEAGPLLAKWNLDDSTAPASSNQKSSAPENGSAATIRLKNGRTIRADAAIVGVDKIEYTSGESTYKIPTNIVQEVTRSPSVPSADATQRSQGISSAHQTSQPRCGGTCSAVFFVQVLMGLDETQRFRLLDDANHDLTGQADWYVWDSADEVDFSVVNGVPRVYSKKYGMVHLYATVGDKTAMARIYIVKPDEMASNKLGRRGFPTFNDSRRPLALVPDPPFAGRMP